MKIKMSKSLNAFLLLSICILRDKTFLQEIPKQTVYLCKLQSHINIIHVYTKY